jgi:hypothetical protein
MSEKSEHESNKQIPAFPSMMQMAFGQETGWQTGMTLRDFFAAKAMQSLLQLMTENDFCKPNPRGDVASTSYKIADAMIAERNLVK